MDSVATIKTKDDGKTYDVPESCIGNASDARDTIATLVKSERIRSDKRARFNGMLNGNPPWPKLLREKGQADRANFTQREAEGFMAAAKTPYYALMFKPERFVQLTLDYGDADPGLLAEWSGKIATRYQYAMEDWDGLDMHAQRSHFQMIAHGSGPLVWEDADDWHSSSRMAGQILVPDDASADIDEWDTVGCPRSYLPTALWRKIKNEGKATDLGWNVPAAQKAIMLAAPEAMQKTFETAWESYEAAMRKGSTGYDAKSKRIFVTDLFQKEFSGSISHFIVLTTSDGNSQIPVTDTAAKDDDPKKGFLFRKLDRFDCWDRIICPFLYDVGPDGQWHSVKGAGPKIFDFCSASDRLFCRTLDGAMKASGVIVKAKDAQGLQESAFTDVCGGTVIGPGYDTQQQRIMPNLEAPLLAKRELSNTLSRNTGQYRAHFLNEENAPTLGQEQMNATEQNVLAEGDASRFLHYLDRFHRETFRRIIAMGQKLFARKGGGKLAPSETSDDNKNLTSSERGALEFYSGCIEDGIPEQILKFENFCRIKATRLAGNGSQQMGLMIGKELTALLPTMDERGRNYALRFYATTLAGNTIADAIYPPYNTPQIADSHMSLAQLENNFLRMPGGKVMVDPSQDHVIHFNSHRDDIGAHAQEMQGGQGDPHMLLTHLEQAGPHMHEHLQAVASDPTRKQQVKGMADQWQNMSKMADQLAQQVQEADQAAAKNQPPQAPDPKLIAALADVQGNLAIKRQKMIGDMALKTQKQNFTLRSKDIEQAHNIRLKNREVAMNGAKAA